MILLKQGEVREIGVEFANSTVDSFVINGADYNITNDKGAIQNGNAQIDDKRVLTIFNATDIGTYYVEFAVHIGPEIYKPKIIIKVQ